MRKRLELDLYTVSLLLKLSNVFDLSNRTALEALKKMKFQDYLKQ